MISDINEAASVEAAPRLRQDRADTWLLYADATVEDDVEQLIPKTVECFGGLYIAANIVGDAHRDAAGPEFHKQSLESWDRTQAVSLRSVFRSMKHEITQIIEHDGGGIDDQALDSAIDECLRYHSSSLMPSCGLPPVIPILARRRF